MAVEPLEDRRLLSVSPAPDLAGAAGEYDFGDAPDNYGTTLAADAAYHEAIGPTLGSTRDAESDGLPTTAADGDDADGTDDEDGVTFGTIQVAQLDATVTVNVQNVTTTAYLDAWIDFNGDGSFGGAGEHIAASVSVSEGDYVIEFDVPSTAVSGEVYARFRLSTDGDLGWTGAAADGEVEDHQTTISPPESSDGDFVSRGAIVEDSAWWREVCSADVDGDGDMDLLAACNSENTIVWCENDGQGNFAAHIVTASDMGVYSVFAADLDGDGDIDVLSTSETDDQITWYENDGAENFSSHTIATELDGARSVFAADVDGDGDLDVLSASGNDATVAWHENDGNEGFTTHTITNSADGARSVFAADVDGDGDMDVVFASLDDNTIACYLNDGDEHFTVQTVTAAGSGVHSITSGDMDGDGDLDLLSAAYYDGTIAWYENDGYGNFISHVISDTDEVAYSAIAADLNGDGSLDVLTAGVESGGPRWYANDGAGNFTVCMTSSSTDYSTYSNACAADLDSDGDLDIVLSPSRSGQQITWMENSGASSKDYGDAPDSYGTTLASDGARHRATGPMLGATRDVEAAALAGTGADGDDSDGSDDEDGVAFGSIQVGVLNATVTVNVQNVSMGARLSAWIDFDGDGVFESDEQIADYLAVSEGDNIVTFEVPVSAIVGETYARFRLSSTEDLDPTGPAADGEVEDYTVTILAPTADFGDAPDSYGTTLNTDGAWHLVTGPTLGSTRDDDSDGLPTTSADGDDTDGTDDEDGVAFGTVRVGEGGALTVNVQNAASGALLNAWIDFDGDGVFDSDEQIADCLAVVEGDNTVTFTVPLTATLGSTYARFRLSTAGDLDPTGGAADGEVEDYSLTILAPIADFGDAPDSYGTTLDADGAWHLTTGPTLGATRDVDSDGQPTTGADGDDTTDTADEDGVTFVSDIIPGQTYTTVNVNVQGAASGAKLDAWIDFDGDGVFESSEQIADSVDVVNGDNLIAFDVPASAVTGGTYARFRLSTDGDLSATGGATDGEVEDYAVTIIAPTTDYGDAPDTYGTSLASDGARHVGTGPTLGAARDLEPGGLPTAEADGDDADGSDDEDGVTFVSQLIAGRTGRELTVNVQNASSGGKLDAWIDFNGDGVFSSDEQIADSVDVVEGDNTITFDVPESAVAGTSYARFRLSTAGDLDPTGLADDGEVEDYAVAIYSENLELTRVDLGTVDFLELSGIDLSSESRAYSLSTMYGGYLTIAASLDSSGGEATVRLIDGDEEVIAEVTTENGYAKIDHLDLVAGTTYALQVTGTNSDVTLRICNLVEVDDQAVTVHSTSNDDAFTYASGSTHALSINGIDYEFALDAITTVDFDGGEGTDSATLTGSAGDETAAFYPGHGSMTTTDSGFVVTVAGTEDITLNSGGGNDEVELEDSDGDDTVVATTTQMTLSGTPVDGSPYSLTANNFRYAHAYARNGGDDTATLEGSEDADRIKAYPDFVRLFGSGFYNRVKFFSTVAADALGGDDNGVMLASDNADVVWAMKDDIRIAQNVELGADESPDYDTLAYNVTIAGCEIFTARADGDDDWIELHDSAGKDVLIAKPHKIMMMNGPTSSVARGEEYTITARGFTHMASVADQGGDYDAAKLYDSSEDGTDVWAAAYSDGETWSTMSSPSRLLYEVAAFEQIGGYGFNGGLGEDHGTNTKDHADDVDFVFEYGYWE